MKKLLTVILKSLAALAIALVLFLAVIFIINVVSNKSELAQIEPYGQLIPVDGKQMNVVIQGKGEETVVLLPGYGTASPALDFQPLIDELSPFYKVVVVEPFGYGLSDQTPRERTTDNIVSEIHEALQHLQIDRYTLMGHSIAGIYGLDYVNKYPNEVIAFVGIDSSVPTQGGMDAEFPLNSYKFLKASGLMRLLVKLSGDPYASLPYDDQAKEQMKLIANKNMFNPTVLNEMNHFNVNFKAAEKLTFPKNLPLLLFIQGNNTDVKGWIPLHEAQAQDSVYGKVVLFDGGHYLHHTKSKEIVEGYREYMKGIK